MQFGKAFSYVFEDKEWFKKLAIFGLISLIPVLGQIVLMGWMIDIIKKFTAHEPITLPELDFGGQLGRGFSAFVISFVYALPVLVLSIIQAIVQVAATGITGMSENSEMGAVGGGLILVVSICFSLLYFLYSIFMYFLLPIAYGRYAETGKISEALKFGAVLSMTRKNISPLFITVLGVIVAGIIAPLGFIACAIGVLLTLVYSCAIMGHLYGQAYAIASENA